MLRIVQRSVPQPVDPSLLRKGQWFVSQGAEQVGLVTSEGYMVYRERELLPTFLRFMDLPPITMVYTIEDPEIEVRITFE